MTAEDRACAVQLLRAAAADHLTHLDPAERDELVERISGAIERCARKRAVDELRHLAEVLHFVPLSEREAGAVSDYTAGMNAAGDIALLCADALTRHEEAL